VSPKDTVEPVSVVVTVSYSQAIGPPPFEVMIVNPAPGVEVDAPWRAPAIIMSAELLVDTCREAVVPKPFAVAGGERLESNGVLVLAPLTPKAINPLYSPPYWKLAQPEIDSVMVSLFNGFELTAQNSAIWSLLVPVVPSLRPEACALSDQASPAESDTENVQLV